MTPTSEPKQPEVDVESPHPIIADDSVLPAFMTSAILSYLRGVSSDPVWQNLVSSYLEFEKSSPITGVSVLFNLAMMSVLMIISRSQKLSMVSRPSEVHVWIKHHIHKKDEPIKVNPVVFGAEFCAWWTALQPDWQVLPDGKFNRKTPSEEQWTSLGKGGSSGLYVVVVALSWWIRAVVNSGQNDTDAKYLMEDICWLLRELSAKKTSGKRPRSDGNGSNSTKRRVLFKPHLPPDD